MEQAKSQEQEKAILGGVRNLSAITSGEKEPGNTPELTSIYGQLRNSEQCYRLGFADGHYTPDQILLLRFFQGVKKNFNKYYGDQLRDAYEQLDDYAEKNPNSFPATLIKISPNAFPRLLGDSLLKMSRSQTLQAISLLTGTCGSINCAVNFPKLQAMLVRMNNNLYNLRCLDPTWHEYIEGVPLVAPTCQ